LGVVQALCFFVGAGVLSKYLQHLHPRWALESKRDPRLSEMMKQRLRNTGEVTFTEHGCPTVEVCARFVCAHALAGKETKGHWTVKWGLMAGCCFCKNK
jgi:hypothetical protein